MSEGSRGVSERKTSSQKDNLAWVVRWVSGHSISPRFKLTGEDPFPAYPHDPFDVLCVLEIEIEIRPHTSQSQYPPLPSGT